MLEIEDQTEDSPGGLSLRGLAIAAGDDSHLLSGYLSWQSPTDDGNDEQDDD